MWHTTQMVPSLRSKVESLLTPSAQAAAATCTGGSTGRACGQKWYTGEYDNIPGLGQEMNALETIQGLLIDGAAPPLEAKDIKTVRDITWGPQSAQSAKVSGEAFQEMQSRRTLLACDRTSRWDHLWLLVSVHCWRPGGWLKAGLKLNSFRVVLILVYSVQLIM
jgi:hypothetical protein